MEGLEYGWKKSVKKYHFFEKGWPHAICHHATFLKSSFKVQEFLTEMEFTAEMKVCLKCRRLRQTEIKIKIIDNYKQNKGYWDDKHVCPNCKCKVIFWNSGKKDSHVCTVCDKMVVLS